VYPGHSCMQTPDYLLHVDILAARLGWCALVEQLNPDRHVNQVLNTYCVACFGDLGGLSSFPILFHSVFKNDNLNGCFFAF